jgi:hypothetical protein
VRLALAIVCVARLAHAEPWAAWVGDYTGPMRWTGCTTPHPAAVTLALDATDAVMAIDLAPAGTGLPALSLVDEDPAWVAQSADLTVRLARPRANALDVAIRFDSGCAGRGTLARAVTGLAACDRLAAWARIEARCTKLHDVPLEPAIPKERGAWLASRGAARTRLGEQCALRASRVETELVDAACAPSPDPAIGVRAPACVAVVAAAGRVARCAAIPPDVKAPIARLAGDLAAAAQTGEPSTAGVVDAQCRELQRAIDQLTARHTCP